MGAERQQFDSLLIHTAHGSRRYSLPWSFSTFDYRELCNLVWKGCDARFETAKVNGRADVGTDGGLIAVDTDRGILSAPLVVDALGWRRILAGDDVYQPPDAPLSRGLEVHPGGSGEEMEIWIDRRYVPAGYGWSFPADDEVRVGIGSFDPRFHVRQTTELLAEDLGRDRVRYQGNWIPHKLRAATEGGVFFVGDSAGHCLPLTAEGIRTAFYFAIALGRELRAVLDGTRTREEAAARYAAFNDSHERRFRWMLRVQRLIPRVPPRLLGPIIRLLGSQRFVDWSFDHYLRIAPPEFAEVSAHDQQRAGDQQRDAEHPPRRERDLIEAK
jgi:flavin-dependent dehydrogenase